MTFNDLSKKQEQVFRWCYHTDYKAIICDGAVRSGKTICMITSFILWAMRMFNDSNFGICGKTVASAERNIIRPLQTIADITAYFKIHYSRQTHMLTVENTAGRNYFFVFGGRDESSYTLLQGITLSGVLLDEVALMPESFVNQAIARCLSVPQSRYWFNCNPESPSHWFYNQWVQQANKKNALHIHFLMSDNPIMTDEQLREAENQFSGVFYARYIQGLWVVAEGLIYPMFKEAQETPPEGFADKYVLTIDYGTQNAFAGLLWGLYGKIWYAVEEYYYSGREKGVQKTDDEYAQDMDEFIDGYIEYSQRMLTIVDPSAASFIAALRRRGKYKVIKADNDVLDGIRETATAMQTEKIKIAPGLTHWEKEIQGYVWSDGGGQDHPVKVNDHCVTGDTLVMTDKGEVPIKDLVGKEGKVYSYSRLLRRAVKRRFYDVRKTRENALVYCVKLKDGTEIKCTSDHRILTQRGYIEACMLRSDDQIIKIEV